MADLPNFQPPTDPAIQPPLHDSQPRRLGTLNGMFKIPDDFDTMCQEEIIALFEGRIE